MSVSGSSLVTNQQLCGTSDDLAHFLFANDGQKAANENLGGLLALFLHPRYLNWISAG